MNVVAHAIPCRASSLLPVSAGLIFFGAGDSAKDVDLTCYKTLATKAITCLQMVPIFLERLLYLQNPNNPALPLPMKVPMTNILKTPFQLSRIPVGGAMLFNHLRYSKILRVGVHVATSLMAGVSLGRGCSGVGPAIHLMRSFMATRKQEDRHYEPTRTFCLRMLL